MAYAHTAVTNKDEIHGSTGHGTSDESTTNVSATFSCEMCNEKFNSREELKHLTMQEHTDDISENITNTHYIILVALFMMCK